MRGDNLPTNWGGPAGNEHMPFEGHRRCSEWVAALPAETGGDGHKRGSAADKGHVRTHVEGRF